MTAILSLALQCSVLGAGTDAQGFATQTNGVALHQDKTVRMIYLVSKDRDERKEYREAIENAIRDIQKWYGKQLGGPTFRLHHPVVEVVHSDKPASWFTTNPNGGAPDDWGFNNSLAESQRLLGAGQGDTRYVWVVYSDGPGNKGRSAVSFSYLPEDDLLGLVGKHPTQKNPLRWIGGLGHELGHAFGLPHPLNPTRDADAIMWTGMYNKYPNGCYLTESDKRTLLHSPFFFTPGGAPVLGQEDFTEKHLYDGGFFGKLKGERIWVERKTDSAAAFYFDELKRDGGKILLKDAGRGLSIELPVGGGECRISSDDGAHWQNLYQTHQE